MRRLLPPHDDEVDLVEAYAYPPDRRWVRGNFVASVDGSVVVQGRSGALTGPADQRLFKLLRGLSDVVLVGAGTARIEGYRASRPRPEQADLRARLGLRPLPVLAVVSARLDLDPLSPLFEGPERTRVITSAGSDPQTRERLAKVADVVVAGDQRVEIDTALDLLAADGLRRVLCEGGPHLLGEVVASGCLDELCLTVAPLLVGGGGPRLLDGPAVGDGSPVRLADLLEEDGNLFARYVLTGA
jgi:riboflavin biosynthesis pyrimidine reductase